MSYNEQKVMKFVLDGVVILILISIDYVHFENSLKVGLQLFENWKLQDVLTCGATTSSPMT